MSISAQLKALREQAGLSQKKIAIQLGITQGAYSLIENGQNSITTEHLLNLSKLYSVSTDHILKGSNDTVIKSTKNGFIPLINIDAHAGYVENRSNNEWMGTLQMYKIPGFDAQNGQKLFEVEGDSMMPTLLQSDILITQSVRDFSEIMDGAIAVVVTAKSVLVKRVRKKLDHGSLVLISDNKNYEDINFPLSDVDEVLTVKGKITSSLNVTDINLGNKMSTMEKNITEMQHDMSQVLNALNIEETK